MDPKGSIFVLNLVCRNESLKKGYMAFVRELFPFVYVYDVQEEVNTILFCFSEAPNLNSKSLPPLVKQSIEWINSFGCQDSNAISGKNSKQSAKSKDKKKLVNSKNEDNFFGVLSDVESLTSNFKVLKL